MASLHTRGLPWSPPAATSTRLEAPRPLGRAHDPRLASLGAGVYQPDWDEIDLGDDFRGGDGDEGEERDTRDMDTFEGAFGDDDGVLTNAPRLRSLDRASRDAEASERAWDAEEGGGAGTGTKKAVKMERRVGLNTRTKTDSTRVSTLAWTATRTRSPCAATWTRPTRTRSARSGAGA